MSLTLAGCGSSSGGSTRSTTAAGDNTTHASSTAWTGLGAKLADFESAHPKGSEGCSAGGCYGIKVPVDGTPMYEYVLLTTTTEGRVDGFERSFADGTSAATAKEAVTALMPPDTRTISFTVAHTSTGSCGLWTVQSATLGKWFANPKVSNGTGVMGIDLHGDNANLESTYSESAISTASVNLGPENAGNNC